MCCYHILHTVIHIMSCHKSPQKHTNYWDCCSASWRPLRLRAARFIPCCNAATWWSHSVTWRHIIPHSALNKPQTDRTFQLKVALLSQKPNVRSQHWLLRFTNATTIPVTPARCFLLRVCVTTSRVNFPKEERVASDVASILFPAWRLFLLWLRRG